MEVNNELHKQRNEIRDRIKENDEEYRRKKTILNCDEEYLYKEYKRANTIIDMPDVYTDTRLKEFIEGTIYRSRKNIVETNLEEEQILNEYRKMESKLCEEERNLEEKIKAKHMVLCQDLAQNKMRSSAS